MVLVVLPMGSNNKVSPCLQTMVFLVLLCFNLVGMHLTELVLDIRNQINKVPIISFHQNTALQAKSSRISRPTTIFPITNCPLHTRRRHLHHLLISLWLILAARTTTINILIWMTLIMIMFLGRTLPRRFTLIMLRRIANQVHYHLILNQQTLLMLVLDNWVWWCREPFLPSQRTQ